MMHLHGTAGVVWYGGVGHKLLGGDGGSECYRCGMFIENDAFEELVPDCGGPATTGHHWQADGRGGIECAYGDAHLDLNSEAGLLPSCTRA